MMQAEFDFLQGLSPAEMLDFTDGSVVIVRGSEVEVILPTRGCCWGMKVFGTGPTVNIAAENAFRLTKTHSPLD